MVNHGSALRIGALAVMMLASGGPAPAQDRPSKPPAKDVERVALGDLMPILPRVAGWTRAEPVGERITEPIPTTSAKAIYERAGVRVQVQIVDSALNDLLAPLMDMVAKGNHEKRRGASYERATAIKGQPAIEKWDDEAKLGELTMLVHRRFLVTAEGQGAGILPALKELASHIDFSRLAALK